MKNARLYNEVLQACKTSVEIDLQDYSQYEAGRCNNGGCYSFTTTFKKVEVEGPACWQVVNSTSAEFAYCEYYGHFCNNNCEDCQPTFEMLTSKEVASQIERFISMHADEDVSWKVVR